MLHSSSHFELFQKLEIGIVVHAPDSRILFCNNRASELLGLSQEQMIGKKARDAAWRFVDEAEREMATAQYPVSKVLETLQPVKNMVLGIRRHNQDPPVWVNVSAYSEVDTSGALRWVVVNFIDINQSKQNERELRASESLFHAVVDNAAVGIAQISPAGRFLQINQEFCRIIGYSQHEVLTGEFTFQKITFAEDLQVDLAHVNQLLNGDSKRYTLEKRYIRKDGEIVWVSLSVFLQSDATGNPLYFISAVQEINDRKQAEEELLQSRTRLAGVINSAMDTIVSADEDLRIVLINPAAERMFGYTAQELINQPLNMLLPERFRAAHDHKIEAFGRTGISQRRLGQLKPLSGLRKNGEEFPIEASISKERSSGRWIYTVIVRDITERINLEDRLRQSQRLEAVGQLTGGVAHDFNNLLTVIMGNSDLLIDQLRDVDAASCEMAQSIMIAAKRGEDLTHRLLAFARKQALDPKAVNVNQLVRHMEPMLRRTLGEHIRIGFFDRPGVLLAMVDPGQMESALLNLCLNSRDAMPGGGQLTIETNEVVLDDKYAEQHPDCIAGRYVMLAVSDTGIGIPQKNLNRVFEPFYTTKDKAGGTGLGLAMVYGFIKQSEGYITIYSELGQGTTVRMYLKPAQERQWLTEEPSPGALQNAVGNETILLVEDEDLVRLNAQRLLSGAGYTVLEASNGPEALETIRSREDIDLLFTDVVMPGGMSGRDLVDQAMQLRPRIKVLYASGYADNAIVHHGRLDPGVQLLSKPYRRDELLRRIRALLDSANPNSM